MCSALVLMIDFDLVNPNHGRISIIVHNTMSHHVTQCHTMSRNVTQCHAMSHLNLILQERCDNYLLEDQAFSDWCAALNNHYQSIMQPYIDMREIANSKMCHCKVLVAKRHCELISG